MPRINQDPGLQVCPDFAADQITQEQAAEQLANTWTQENDALKERWVQQQQEDQRAREQDEAEQREEEAERRCEREREKEAEQREAEKKKPKMNRVNNGRPVADAILRRPAAFTLNKLANFEYVELWYFSPDGCLDAHNTSRASADEAFGLAKLDDFMALKPVSSFRASRNVIRDEDLDWYQFFRASNSLLDHIPKAHWPQENIDSLATFFVNIQCSKLHDRSNGGKVLLTYQARVRREWHDALKRDEGFDIGIINERLMNKIADEVYDNERRAAGRR
jgi:hypothetical protein